MKLSGLQLNNNGLLFLSLTVVAIVSLLTVLSDKRERVYHPGISEVGDKAVNQALVVYQAAKSQRVDLSNGPCLSNALMPGWVLDLVHNPRQEIDERPENQCTAYLEDHTKHVVELDIEGNVVRAK